MIFVGTSGYSYKDWYGKFYPLQLKKEEELSFYSKEFNFLELNYSFYRIPNPRNLEKMETLVPDSFKFALKLYRSFTHEQKFEQTFLDSLHGFSAKLSILLAQFPFSFKCTNDNRDYLLRLRDYFSPYDLSFEFRHDSWTQKEALVFIKKENLGWVAVDEPILKGLMPPIVLNSGKNGYVRFHGRNQRKWWNNDASHERYTYEYTKEELSEWLPRFNYLSNNFENTYVACNNHYNAGAVRSAKLIKELLEKDRLLVM